MTLQNGIEVSLRESLPELTEIVDVTDHAVGENPFYAN
jgi:Fe/S biogenesis protein NfuA